MPLMSVHPWGGVVTSLTGKLGKDTEQVLLSPILLLPLGIQNVCFMETCSSVGQYMPGAACGNLPNRGSAGRPLGLHAKLCPPFQPLSIIKVIFWLHLHPLILQFVQHPHGKEGGFVGGALPGRKGPDCEELRMFYLHICNHEDQSISTTVSMG